MKNLFCRLFALLFILFSFSQCKLVQSNQGAVLEATKTFTKKQASKLFLVDVTVLERDSVRLEGEFPNTKIKRVVGQKVCDFLTKKGKSTAENLRFYALVEWDSVRTDSTRILILYHKKPSKAMKYLVDTIYQRLATIEALQEIDVWQEQIEQEEESNPMSLPACYVEFLQLPFEQKSAGATSTQLCQVAFRLHLVANNYYDSRQGNPEKDDSFPLIALADEVYKVLQFYTVANISPFLRKRVEVFPPRNSYAYLAIDWECLYEDANIPYASQLNTW